MAEAALFSVASKLLSTIASSTFVKAYTKASSIWEVMDELDKFKRNIKTIQAVLLDAEKKQHSSHAVNDWIKRVRDVLYDADDLFDEVATDDLRKQIIMKGDNMMHFLKKVHISCFKLNSIVSRNSIAERVKVIRKSLLEISSDMAGLGFLLCDKEVETPLGMRRDQDPGSYVDSNNVIGRTKEKKVILKMLSNNLNDALVVIAIVGIGGMGKTTLAQLIFNNDTINKKFKQTWFACISDTSDDKEVLGKIFQSICEQNYGDYSINQLQFKIRELIEGKKFLLVLDDVWDDDHGRWLNRMSLFSKCAKGSKILVTTRSSSVTVAMDALETLNLGGLSEDDSWDLFKKFSFAPGKENDQRWIDTGREIVKKCVNVPLAIRSISSLLYTKTIQEWESFRDLELSKIEERSGDSVMNALKLSYANLPSNWKHCFAYCCVFPKDFEFEVKKLIYMWIAQGYVQENHGIQTVEQVGYSYFMDLLRRGFFQEARENKLGEIESCKMHDLVHDLAQYVAGEEIAMVNGSSNPFNKRVRHASVVWKDDDIKQIVGRELNLDLHSTNLRQKMGDDFWKILGRPLDYKRIRSVVLCEYSHYGLTLNQQFTKFKCLRALSIPQRGVSNVLSCIEELKHLRYLDLSRNGFKNLPSSLTNLLNLLTLDLGGCYALQALPSNFRNLRNLRCLNIRGCYSLRHMPPGIGQMSCLQYLSDFKTGIAIKGMERSKIDALSRLQQLRGELRIEFAGNIEEWDGDDCWQLPMSVENIVIDKYAGTKIPINCCNHNSLLSKLAFLELKSCLKVKYLPPLRCLPYLKNLRLCDLSGLEYVEEENDDKHSSNALFFPRLEILLLLRLTKLKGWGQNRKTMFPRVSRLSIHWCPVLESIPLCPRVEILRLDGSGRVARYLMSPSSSLEALTCLQTLRISYEDNLEIMHLASSPHLQEIWIYNCNQLTSFHVEALSSLRKLEIKLCERLKKLHILNLNVLEKLVIRGCDAELDLWGQQKACGNVDWVSLPNLRRLEVNHLPEKIPNCLQHRRILGKLKIIEI